MNLQMFKLVLEKIEEPEIKLPTSDGSSKKRESSRKNIYFCFMPKPLTVWITRNYENSERDGNTRPPDLPLEKPIFQVRKQQLELDREQQTGSK